MNSIQFFEFGKGRYKVNTYIGGIGATVNTPALLASKLGVSVNVIKLFSVIGSDVQCSIVGSFTLSYGLMGSGCTYFESTQVTAFIGSQEFNLGNQLNRVVVPNLVYARGATFYGNSGIQLYYCPRATNIGEYDSSNLFVGVGGRTRTFEYIQPGFILYCNPILATANAGSPVADINTILSLGGIVRYVTNFTPPNAITDLTVSNIIGGAVQINLTTPFSTNIIEYYEVYINGVYYSSITDSNRNLYGLELNTSYNISLVAVDIFYNKSLNSNTVSFLTSSDTSILTPIAYYALDYNSLDSVNGINGASTDITYTTGKSGQSASFNGSTSKIDCTNNSLFQLTAGSISCYIKTSSAGSSHRGIIVKQSAYSLFLLDGVLCTYSWGGMLSGNKSTGINLNDGLWHHVVMTFNSGGKNGTKIYLDGALVLTTTITVASQATQTIIGAGSPSTQFFNGLIDGAAIWDRYLTAREIYDIYTTQSSGSELT